MVAPQGRRPLFAQTYIILKEDAVELRKEYISKELSQCVKDIIVKELEEIMRNNPYGRTFSTLGEQLKAIEAKNGELPHFQVYYHF